MKPEAGKVRDLAAGLAPKAIQRRRHMHMHPELSYKEVETSRWLRGQLDELGIPWNQGYGNHGIRAIIDRGPGPVIALRADFDALPIEEQNDVPFKSTIPGVMHACGHDLHSSVMLSTLELVAGLDNWRGKLVGIFQPAEEVTPGGALGMISAGVLESPKVDRIYGEHINPDLDAGIVGFRPGLTMASVDEIHIVVRGRGGHAASPHLTVDPVAISAQILTYLNQVIARSANPVIPSTLSFGRIIGAGAMNVIPDKVEISGTFRTVNEEWRHEALEKITRIASSVAESMGATCDIEIIRGYPVLNNDAALANEAADWARELLGDDKVIELPLVLWAEDFAYFCRETRGCFYNLGIANKKLGYTSPLHSSTLMIDEAAITTGIEVMSWLALRSLQGS